MAEDALRHVYHGRDARAGRDVTITGYGSASLRPEERARLGEAVQRLVSAAALPGVLEVLDSGVEDGVRTIPTPSCVDVLSF